MSTPAVKKVAAEILRYCHTHPRARDSIEGITWRIAYQCFDDAKNLVPRAVDLLVERGDFEWHVLPDGSQVYGCNPQVSKENGRCQLQ